MAAEPAITLAEFRRLWEEREEVEAIVSWLLQCRNRTQWRKRNGNG